MDSIDLEEIVKEFATNKARKVDFFVVLCYVFSK
jgi:hypothetical protein